MGSLSEEVRTEVLCGHICDLEAENETLIVKLNAEHIVRQNVEIENAKLRELVADMWNGAVWRMDFAERHAFIGEFVDRMRELEVHSGRKRNS